MKYIDIHLNFYKICSLSKQHKYSLEWQRIGSSHIYLTCKDICDIKISYSIKIRNFKKLFNIVIKVNFNIVNVLLHYEISN